MKIYILLLILLPGFAYSQGKIAVQEKGDMADTANTTLVEHAGYTSMMHNKFHVPVWVYHKISKKLLDTVKRERPSGYPKDKLYPALKTTLYKGSEYDHGHLAPAADFKRSEELYIESHYMTNMAPQHGCLNQIGWCYLESMTRNWAAESAHTVTHVTSGCLLDEFMDTLCYGDGFKVYVPKHFFKAVLIEDTVHPEKSRAIGFIVPNGYLTAEAAQNAQCSIDHIELVTGLDLFPGVTKLSVATYAKVEGKIGAFGWKGYRTDCGTKGCGGVYGRNRVKPGGRTKLKCD